jgi:hypothetical protein
MKNIFRGFFPRTLSAASQALRKLSRVDQAFDKLRANAGRSRQTFSANR